MQKQTVGKAKPEVSETISTDPKKGKLNKLFEKNTDKTFSGKFHFIWLNFVKIDLQKNLMMNHFKNYPN